MADFVKWKEKNKALLDRIFNEIFVPDLEVEWEKSVFVENHHKARADCHPGADRHVKNLEQAGDFKFTSKDKRTDTLQDREHHQLLPDCSGARSAKIDTNSGRESFSKENQKQSSLSVLASYDTDLSTRERSVPAEEHRLLLDRFNELSQKYQSLSQKVKYLEKKSVAVLQKNKDMKESVRAWQEYADRQSSKRKVKHEVSINDVQSKSSPACHQYKGPLHTPSGSNSTTLLRTCPAPTTPEYPSDVSPDPLTEKMIEAQDWSIVPLMGSLDDDRISHTSATPKAALQRDRVQSNDQDSNPLGQKLSFEDKLSKFTDKRHAEPKLPQFYPSSSQTTEDERGEIFPCEARIPKSGLDEDIPQVVSARSLKRKRNRPIKLEPGVFVDQPIEGTPERPFRIKEEQRSSPPMDLHKSPRVEQVDLDAPTPTILQTPRHPRRKACLHSNMTGTLSYQRSNSAPFTPTIKQEKSTVADCPSDSHVGLTVQQCTTMNLQACSESSDSASKASGALQPLDVNIVIEGENGTGQKRAKRRKGLPETPRNTFMKSREACLSTGDSQSKSPTHMAHAQRHPAMQAAQTLRLSRENVQDSVGPDSTKNAFKPVPVSTAAFDAALASSRRIKSGQTTSAIHAEMRDGPDFKNWPNPITDSAQRRSSTRTTNIRSSNDQGCLRRKPLAELRMRDFKPNPAYDQRYDYASSETLRKRADRMCAPGCVSLQCCGSIFRAFVEAQAPLSASEEESLLKDYLGDAYDHLQLTQMSAEEHTELVLQARTRKMANECGKHRELRLRCRTPPGFWRIDFPTTQEQQEDLDKANELEKTVIHERWLEAQRRGGRWIFKDE